MIFGLNDATWGLIEPVLLLFNVRLGSYGVRLGSYDATWDSTSEMVKIWGSTYWMDDLTWDSTLGMDDSTWDLRLGMDDST